MPSMYQRGAARRGAVRYRYGIDSGCSATGATFPRNSWRKNRSRGAARSLVTTCTSSWFIRYDMRSLAVNVSKAKLMGAMRNVTMSRGTASADALPASEKSVSSTVIFSRGLKSNSFSMKCERVFERPADVRDDERLRRV